MRLFYYRYIPIHLLTINLSLLNWLYSFHSLHLKPI